ncbi:hypothetical protein U14_05029 [Candidatus Moduliflexus flocculans]|uniref:PA14 domain-containing protein n=1 Tax=Candidatus Moduliflexus flocculans TaxID=1499966 RepID=A0A081BQS4_9BACT|nr:hypothetical protein U14_05029 [Candidatus Moduliflexus flocculans]
MTQKNFRFLLREYGFIVLVSLVLFMMSVYWLIFPSRGLLAEYYPNSNWNGQPILSLLEKSFTDYEMEFVEDLTKHADFPRTNFSIRWTGWIRIDNDGVYRFGTKSDDGSFVAIDQTLVIDNGGVHASQEAWGEVFLSKGMHHIEMSYFNSEAAYRFAAFWAPPNTSITPLPSSVLFPSHLSRVNEIVSRYAFIFKVIYLALWCVLLAMIFIKAGWLRSKRDVNLYSPPVAFHVVAMQLLLIACIGIVIVDNLAMLTAKQPWRAGPLVPKSDRKLSTILRVKGSGDSDDKFCAILRALYPERTIWLPEEHLFKPESLLQKATMKNIKVYHQQIALTSKEARRLHFRVYHRFIYNPFQYRSDGKQMDKSLANRIDPTITPKLLFIIAPTREEEPSDLVVVQFKRNLYLLSLAQLPERIRGEIYE